MKKVIKLFSLVVILLMTITLTGCKVTKAYKEVTNNNIKPVVTTNDGGQEVVKPLSESTVEELIAANSDHKIIGFLYFNEKDLDHVYIFTSGLIPAEYVDHVTAVYFDENSKEKEGTLPKLPTGLSVGKNFAGWFVDLGGDKEYRVSKVSDIKSGTLVQAKYISYGEGGIIALVCIAIVFMMLALLWGITSLFRFIAPKPKKEEVIQEPIPVSKPFSMADITDEDMMAAALVATIDYHNEIKKDVRVVSIKEIR